MQDFWALHPFVAEDQPQEHRSLRLERVLPGKPRLSSQTVLSFLPRVFVAVPASILLSRLPPATRAGERAPSRRFSFGRQNPSSSMGKPEAPQKRLIRRLEAARCTARRRLGLLHAGPIAETRCQRPQTPSSCGRARQPNTGRERARGAPTQKHGRRLRRRPRLLG